MKSYSELYTSTVTLDHLINYRAFSSSSQNIRTEHCFEHFFFHVNFTYMILTNFCIGAGKITESHLDFYYSSIIQFVRCKYSNFCTEITDIDEQALVEAIYFS